MATCAPHKRPAKIGPSLLASDLADLANESKRVIDAGADYLHLDIMVCARAAPKCPAASTPLFSGACSRGPVRFLQDGHFVPNLTWGAPVVASLRKHTDAFLDCHLMVSKPSQWIDDIAKAGGHQYTFHLEAIETDELGVEAMCKAIAAKGMKVGISIKPGTPVESLEPYIKLVDMVLIMTVEPGFGGQSFMQDMMPKVLWLRTKYPDLDIQVDGGLSPKTIDEAAKAGANMIVAGSSVFKPGQDPRLPITEMRRSVEQHGNGLALDQLTPLPAPGA